MGPNQKNGSNSLGRRSRGQRPGCFEVHMDSPNQWCCRFSGANSFVPNHLYEKCAQCDIIYRRPNSNMPKSEFGFSACSSKWQRCMFSLNSYIGGKVLRYIN